MEKRYDNVMSFLIKRNPQAFLDLLYPGSIFVRFHDTKLAHTQRTPDKIIEAYWPQTGKHFLPQPEVQTYADPTIALRQLLYHIFILWQPELKDLKLAVWSKTLNLTREAASFSYPLHLTVPGPDGGEEPTIDFFCESKKMSDWVPEELIAYGHKELLVLLPATNGEATRETVERMISLLGGDYELLLCGFTVAELIFRVNGQDADLEWLEQRREKMITDPLITRSDLYRDIVAIGEAIGEAKAQAAIEEANTAALQAKAEAAEAKVEAAEAKATILQTMLQSQQKIVQAQQKIVRLITKRFLALAATVGDLLVKITDPDLLVDLLGELALADSAKEAEQCLRNVQAALA